MRNSEDDRVYAAGRRHLRQHRQIQLGPLRDQWVMRDDLGAWYDSQEWVFVDLRASGALALQGDTQTASDTFAWNVGQASENFGEFSELHDAVTADYAGASPMIGFGAGAYLLALFDRGKAGVPTCGAYASEPADPVDAGPESGGPSDGGMLPPDGSPPATGDGGADGGSTGATPSSGSSGCACAAGRLSRARSASILVVVAVGVLATRRRRRR
jgi:hypothetical protein